MSRCTDRWFAPGRRGLSLIAALALLAPAACSDDDGGAEPASSTSATTLAAPSTTRVEHPATSSAPAATAAPTTTAAPATTSTSAGTAYDFSAVAPIVERFIGEHGLNGAGLIVVDRDDGVIDEEYWGVFGPDRVSLVASSSKMITAGVLLRLQDDGRLDVDAPVAAVAPWGSGNPTITPAQLLSNSSGLVGLLPNPGYTPYVCQYLPAGTLQDCAATIFTTPDDDVDIVAPDTEFRYGGAQWQVAGAVAEIASGKSWAQLIDEIYVQPCGLETLGYNNHFAQLGAVTFDYPTSFNADPATLKATDNPNMEGGVYIAPPDYAKLLLMHLRGGRCGSNQVLSQAALDRMHADRIGPAYGGSAGDNTGYGMGWWVDRVTGRITDPGAYGAVPWLDLADGYGAYLVVESDAATGIQLAGLLYEPVDAAVRAR
jgi:CubicO group peptidase (beta-lactamase class C family)